VQQAAVEAGQYGKELARKGITPSDPSTLKEMRGWGSRSPASPRPRPKPSATRPAAVYDKWKARIGADLVTSAEKAVAASRGGS
jgi:hypothetical protein